MYRIRTGVGLRLQTDIAFSSEKAFDGTGNNTQASSLQAEYRYVGGSIATTVDRREGRVENGAHVRVGSRPCPETRARYINI
jgi:hypothetical protein